MPPVELLSLDAVFEAAVAAAISAHNAVDGEHGYAEFLLMPEEEADDELEVAAYIVKLWKAMELDAESLEVGRGEKADSADLGHRFVRKGVMA